MAVKIVLGCLTTLPGRCIKVDGSTVTPVVLVCVCVCGCGCVCMCVCVGVGMGVGVSSDGGPSSSLGLLA